MFAGAGAIKSTAADMLTYLDANLHPDKYAAAAAADSPASTLACRGRAGPSSARERRLLDATARIALAWFFNQKTGNYGHSGGTGGYSSMATIQS